MNPAPPPLISSMTAAFGDDVFEPALFHRRRFALRFELGGALGVEGFVRSFDRGREILTSLFAGRDEVVLVVSTYRDLAPLRGELADCGVRLGDAAETWSRSEPDDQRQRFVADRIPVAAIPMALWAAIAAEIGVRPRSSGKVFLAAPEHGVLAHPYDDRGMDVLAPRDHLAQLYRDLSHLLLDHDRARMDAAFAG
ncbi:MAG: DUF3885 domain-containing protein [Myxococcota bacterium]|nr:DUF3885 domain-containing protein [Myxococcota bacterium]